MLNFSFAERKLLRIQSKPATNNGKEASNGRLVAKEILKSLNIKRDAIFQQPNTQTPTDDPDELSQPDSSKLNAISSLITNTTLYSALEKKLCPQAQAMDAEEIKKLIDADLLNLVRDLESAEYNNDENEPSGGESAV